MSFRRFVVGMLALFGGLVLLLLMLGVGLSLFYWSKTEGVPGKVILEMDLDKEIVEHVSTDPLGSLLEAKSYTVLDVVETLRKAGEDKRVVGLYARIGTTEMGLARIQEIRNAVIAFRGVGKPAVAFAETFGEFGPGNAPYYLATAFDQVYLQPSGDVGLTGLMFKSPFFAGTLEKLGVIPRMDHRGKYKTAMNIFTEKQFTEAHRESTETMMASQFAQITRGIAKGRGFSPDEIRALINRGPFTAEEAITVNLVDGLAYSDEVREIVEEVTDEEAEFLPFAKYVTATEDEEEVGKRQTIAVIYGLGPVHRGESDFSPLAGRQSMGSDTLVEAFRAAIKDDKCRAILFRIDSPGGSYVASDTIWREVVRAKEAKKPVIVSMGDVAASGGYFVAIPAEKIVAQPGTLTGSIGVLAGKPVMTEFWNKIGVTWDEVHTSDHADIWSTTKDYDSDEWKLFQQWLDHVYSDFVGKIAEGRNIRKEKVLEVAEGRVWTGEDAKNLGLVDELGGFPEALRLARQAAGIPEGAAIQLKLFPREETLIEMLSEMLFGRDDEQNRNGAIARVVQRVRPLVRLAGELGLFSDPGVLTMPHVDRIK